MYSQRCTARNCRRALLDSPLQRGRAGRAVHGRGGSLLYCVRVALAAILSPALGRA